MARELSRVFRIFVAVTLFDFIKYIELWHGCVVKRGRVCLMPVLAHFGRFGGIYQQNGPTDRPADERPVKRKFGKNNGLTSQWSFGIPNTHAAAKDVFLMAEKEIYKNYKLFFGN